MVGIAPSQRFSILVDLEDEKELYLFFYNFDLTEVYGLDLNSEGILEAPVPDLSQSRNPSVNPTPIPDPTACSGCNPSLIHREIQRH